jgi:ubiquinone/menaquinone biosynthesis C-methylase UbiE
MSNLYSAKAENYAKYRWDYAPGAIVAIFDSAGITDQTVIADLGAGTGILTQHFVGKAKLVYALEPEAEMRAELEKTFAGNPLCQMRDHSAEKTGLPDHSIDLITVGQAIHWFEPQAARSEFRRILKSGGWLAVLYNNGTDAVYEKAVKTLFAQFSRPGPARRIIHLPMSFYFGHETYQKLLFPFEYSHNWESFLGQLMSSAFLPDEHSPNFGEFEAKAMEVFEGLSVGGRVKSTGETELFLGEIL